VFYLPDINTNKNQFVIWSGGADSTLLLHELAERYGTKRYPVKAISIRHDLVDNCKQNAESLKRQLFLAKAKSEGLHIDNLEITVSLKGFDKFRVYNHGIGQAPIWIANIPHYLADEDYLHFGYIKGDDFWFHKEDFTKTLDSTFALMGKKVEARYPLQYMTKTQILMELEKRGLSNMYVSCQILNEDGSDCGHCASCVSIRNAKLEIEYLEKQKEDKKEIQLLSK